MPDRTDKDQPDGNEPARERLDDEETEDTDPFAVTDYEETGPGRLVLTFLAGLAAGVLVLGLVWVAQARFAADPDVPSSIDSRSDSRVQLSGRDPSPSATPSATASSPTEDATETPSESPTESPAPTPTESSSTAPSSQAVAPADSPLASCALVYDGQRAPLQAVGPALAQWEVHIGAMNQLVVGAITLKQASQFWNDTRVGASKNLEAFRRALRGHKLRTVRCPPPAAGDTAEFRRCSRVVAARNGQLRRAEISMDTWAEHVVHMEMLRRGEMTPEEATAAWLQSWRTGNEQVRDYREAARAAHRLTGTCSA